MSHDLRMRWPRRGILIRLAIYVPLISLLAWRARGGCDHQPDRLEQDPLEQKLAPHRKVITLPDGTQQEIVELTAEEAEAILGHPIPRSFEEPEAKPATQPEPNTAAKPAAPPEPNTAAKPATPPEANTAAAKPEPKPSPVEITPDARPADARPAP